MKAKSIRNRMGFGVIEVIFALFISAIAIATLNIFVTQMGVENKKLSDSTTMARKNYDFLELMNNPTMWKATVLDVKNYAFYSCKLGLTPHPDTVGAIDCTKVDNKFRLVSSESGSIIYDQDEKDVAGNLVGFSPEGTKCFGFDRIDGNDSCPTHYDVSWDLPCLQVGNCKEPLAKVTVKQVTKYKTKTTLDMTKSYNLNVNLPQSVEIAPRDSSYLININSAATVFDVLKTDYSVDTFNLKIKTANSSAGSSITIQNNKLSYTPKANFYGIDKIYYTVEQSLFDKVTKADGVMWVKVMTPYTWVGDGSIAETNNVTGKKWYNLYDKRNWCGTVVNGKCTYFNPTSGQGVSLISDADMRLASLVFNDTCNKCDVLLKTPNGGGTVTVNAIEISEGFPGELKQVDNLSIYVSRNSGNRNSTDPALLYNFWQRGGAFIGANSVATALLDEVSAQDKLISVDRNPSGTSQLRTITRGSMSVNGFAQFAIEGGKFYSPQRLVLYGGFNYIAGNSVFYHQNGRVTVFTRWSTGNIIDAPNVVMNEFAFNGSGGYDYSVAGSFSVKDMIYYQTGYENQIRGFIGGSSDWGNIYVSRNIYLHGAGGFMVNGWAGWGYLNLVTNGTGDQYIYSNLDINGNKDRTQIGRLPLLTVAKPSGTLHFKGDIGFTTGIDYQSGTLKFYEEEEVLAGDKQMIEFASAWNSMFLKNTSGTELVLPNVEFAPISSYIRIETDFRVKGDFIQDKSKYNANSYGYPFGPQTRKIYVEGDVYAKSGVNEYDYNGLVTLEMVGTKDQTIYGRSKGTLLNNISGTDPYPIDTGIDQAFGYLIHVDINKPAGKVTLTGAVGFMGRFRVINDGDGVDATQASISFTNVNDCCAPGYAIFNVDGMPGRTMAIKALNVQRSLNLGGGTLEISGGLNLPADAGMYKRGSISNGRINLLGNLYYNANFDYQTVDVNRASLYLQGTQNQYIYASMPGGGPGAPRVGSFDLTIQKRSGDTVGDVELHCMGNISNALFLENFTLENGNIRLNGCGLNVAKTLSITNGDFTVTPPPGPYGQVPESVLVPNGHLDRGAAPGALAYKTLNNNGTISPAIVAGQ